MKGIELRNEIIAWVDVETTGVDMINSKLLEISCLVTDMAGNRMSETVNHLFPVKNLDEVIHNDVNHYVRQMHYKSGLWKAMRKDKDRLKQTVSDIDEKLYEFLSEYVPDPDYKMVYLGGNSVTLDRNMVERDLPKFHSLFSHRNIDVTSIALMVQNNDFPIMPYMKGGNHRSSGDIEDSAKEYRYYLSRLEDGFRQHD